MKYELNSKANKYQTVIGGPQYQTNQMCNFCGRFNNNCTGELHKLDKFDPNGYCPNFIDRQYGEEQQKHGWHMQTLKNYIKQNK